MYLYQAVCVSVGGGEKGTRAEAERAALRSLARFSLVFVLIFFLWNFIAQQ